MSLTRTKAKLPPPGIYQLGSGEWKEVTTPNGKEQIHWTHEFTDLDGNSQPVGLYATEQAYASVGKGGKLTSPDGGDVSIPSSFAAGMFMDSLEDKGFSARKLKDVDANPGCADGTWVRVEHKVSEKINPATNQPFVNLVVAEVFDGKPGGKTAGKAAKKAATPDDDDDTNTSADDNDDTSDLDASDEEIEAAQEFTRQVLGDPDTHVRNFDSDANGGGVTLQEINTATFKHFKGKGPMKAKIAALVGDPEFHEKHAEGWTFDSDGGVVKLAAKKKTRK